MKVSNLKHLLSTITLMLLVISCGGNNTSRGTGWDINSKKGGFQYNVDFDEQETGPGLVFVEGGTFTKGQVQDDVMHDWNNTPNKQHVMSFYIDETEVKAKDLKEKLPRVAKSWEETEGKVVLPFYGDRSSGGLLVEGINDIVYDKPVYTEGGVDFMRGLAAQKDKAIWASNSNIIKRIDDVSKIASEKFDGADVLGVTGSMSPDANDFATMTGASMGELIKSAPITKKSAKEVDEIMKSIDPDFVGVLSPNIREWLETTTSPKRKSFIRLLDSGTNPIAFFIIGPSDP